MKKIVLGSHEIRVHVCSDEVFDDHAQTVNIKALYLFKLEIIKHLIADKQQEVDELKALL